MIVPILRKKEIIFFCTSELLRQSIHDNEQQQIHLKKRENIHNQTKRKYEELYDAYSKLKDTW